MEVDLIGDPSNPTSQSPSQSQSSSTPQDDLSSRIAAFRHHCLVCLTNNLTHNLIPHSGKVVIFDSTLQVKDAFHGLLMNDINCAPVWDSTRHKYVGMLSVSDFIDILLATYKSSSAANQTTSPTSQSSSTTTTPMSDTPMSPPPSSSSPPPSVSVVSPRSAASPLAAMMSSQRICDWANIKSARGTSINRLLCISPEGTLHEAVRQLLNYRVHRLCVVQFALPDTVLRVLSHHGILRFLRNNVRSLPTCRLTIRDLDVGVFRNLLTVTYDTPLIKTLEIFNQYKVSSVPIVDSRGVPVDIYTRSDVRYLAMDNMYNLEMTLEQALANHKRDRVLPICSRDDTIWTVSGLLVSTMKHSLICVFPDGTIEGIVSLTDIFSFILNSQPPKAESRVASLKQDADQKDQLKIEVTSSGVSVAPREESSVGVSLPIPTEHTRTSSMGNDETSLPNLNDTMRKLSGETLAIGMTDVVPDEDFLR